MSALEVLIPKEEIAARVQELGSQIEEHYKGKDVHVVAVLKGSFMFLADLVRAIDLPMEIHFLGVSSYAGSESTGQVKITHDLDGPMEGKHLLIVEDIVDTGLTLRYLIDNLQARNPESIKVASLLDKPSRRKVALAPDYLGFPIPDKFVVGYGLDFDGLYRNLDHIAIYPG